uniref:Hepcidin n=1 Tax=Gouania willdenowi TaxID=441366 RepID=A0A8C5GAP8_GOUWI
MKTLSVFVAVAIVLTVMCSQQSSAVPVLQNLEETIFLEIPDAVMDETVMDSMKTLSNNRQKRAAKCQFCCKKWTLWILLRFLKDFNSIKHTSRNLSSLVLLELF